MEDGTAINKKPGQTIVIKIPPGIGLSGDKMVLETQLQELVQAFEHKTGLIVDEINVLGALDLDGGPVPGKSTVTTEVKVI